MFQKLGCFSIFLCILLVSCEKRSDLAPLYTPERHVHHSLKHPSTPRVLNHHVFTHRVAKGETLYSIAFRYDYDYRVLASWNHIDSRYIVYPGQVLKLTPPSKLTTKKLPLQKNPSRASKPITFKQKSLRTTSTKPIEKNRYHAWTWPHRGKILSYFSPLRGKKGIDIAGKKGDVVLAASNGVVAYAGSGLSGYGNLIIVKHDGQILTAYGNNSKNRVREGQSVKTGQVIADMGLIERHVWGVHFEIRAKGIPMNPVHFLRVHS